MTPDMVTETKWFKSPYVGVVSLRVLNSYFSLLAPYNFSLVEQGFTDTGHDGAVPKKLLPMNMPLVTNKCLMAERILPNFKQCNVKNRDNICS